jgi:hypothetical protein
MIWLEVDWIKQSIGGHTDGGRQTDVEERAGTLMEDRQTDVELEGVRIEIDRLLNRQDLETEK